MSAPALTSSAHGRFELRDFTADRRMVILSVIAVVIGIVSAYVALGLLRLIGLATNLFYFQRWGTAMVSPRDTHLGWLALVVPIVGGLIIGVMARFGSDKIRGHGIPEAIEAILLRGARVDAKVAVLKPISAAISIGSGGPFGAEGPIIMTGGAFGSLIAQFFRLSDAERTTLLVAGAAAGMSATFAAPVASVLLAVELLLFEWKPRSLVPVTLASVTAGAARRWLLGPGPLFPTDAHAAWIGAGGLLGALLLGLASGVVAGILSRAVYAFEDLFGKLPVHWMWWPAIGGLGIGIGGLIYPPALGVGYDLIGQMAKGDFTWHMVIGILVVKSFIWSFSLGSGTSGGVLAPLLMIGGALGAVCSHVMPAPGGGFWPLIGMGAVLAGAIGSPLTGAVFAFELTHDPSLLLPLLLATIAAYGVTVLTMPRSILTEKLSRRGYHLSREYSVDPLETLTVREVMRTNVVALPAEARVADVAALLIAPSHRDRTAGERTRTQHLYPILGAHRELLGVVTRADLRGVVDEGHAADVPLLSLSRAQREVQTADPGETLRAVAERMAGSGYTAFPVVDPATRELCGLVAMTDLLQARARAHRRERDQERVLHLRMPTRLRRQAAQESGAGRG